jgi:hypothetical protein
VGVGGGGCGCDSFLFYIKKCFWINGSFMRGIQTDDYVGTVTYLIIRTYAGKTRKICIYEAIIFRVKSAFCRLHTSLEVFKIPWIIAIITNGKNISNKHKIYQMATKYVNKWQ